MAAPEYTTRAATLVFDADCGVCRVVVALVLRLDRERRITPVALQSALGTGITEPVSPELRGMSWHVLVDGVLSSDAAVVAAVGDWVRCGRPMAFIARRAPRLSRAVYFTISKRRAWLGKATSRRRVEEATRLIAARATAEPETHALLLCRSAACAPGGCEL